MRTTVIIVAAMFFVLAPAGCWAQAQASPSDVALLGQADGGAQAKSPQDSAKLASSDPAQTNPDQPDDDSQGKQTKRILWIIPNYRAVSASETLPPLSPKTKFWLATQDSFDYSSFVLAGLLAGYSQATNSTPEFHHGWAAYGQYYWHSFVDEAVGNYFTEAIIPSVTHQDPRYYTLGHGTFVHRAGYAISRLFITRTDSGGSAFNVSEIAGNLAGAGIDNFYYPAHERTLAKTAENWGTQVGVDGIADVLKEFWPDIRRRVFRQP